MNLTGELARVLLPYKARGPFKKPKISALPEKLINFIKESRLELKKVSWPTRPQTIRYTLAVILMSLAVAAFLGGLDVAFTYLLNKFVL